MRTVIFDIETSNIFAEVGSNNPADLDLSVLCLWDSEDDTYKSYTQEQLPDLWRLIEHTDMLVGYNSDHFDIPLLNKYYPGDLTQIKSLDLMKEVQQVIGRRLKLDNIAKCTLGAKQAKSADGLAAVEWWRNGEYQKVIDYCIQDVKVTKKVMDYALQHGHLKYNDGPHKKVVELDTSTWQEADEVSMTHTIGF